MKTPRFLATGDGVIVYPIWKVGGDIYGCGEMGTNLI